jgi:acyl carrier protein
MQNSTEIQITLKKIIADVKRIDGSTIDLNNADDFITKFSLSSMDAVAMSIQVAQKFGFGFGQEAEDIDSLASFGSLVKLIEKRVAA